MKNIPQENMVLRTVYLPYELDSKLREVAFSNGVSKGVLIREFVQNGLTAREQAGERTLAEKVSARAKAGVGRPIGEAYVATAQATSSRAVPTPEAKHTRKRASNRHLVAAAG
jgi:hypothetical protein